jgi:Co/Zn/Cd efflux system component
VLGLGRLLRAYRRKKERRSSNHTYYVVHGDLIGEVGVIVSKINE